jgi:WD40 repeat protein
MWVEPVPGGSVTALAYTPDGRTLYTQDTGRWYTAWDTSTHVGERRFQYPESIDGEKGFKLYVSNHFPRMFVSADGRYLVSNLVPPLVWDLQTEELHCEVPKGYEFAGVSMGVGRMRVECVTDDWKGIRCWYFATQKPGDELHDWPVPGTIKTHHFSPDGRSVALLNWNNVVTVCDVESRSAIHSIELPKQSLQHCRFAPDGNTLVMYMSDGITIWDLASKSVRVPLVACDKPYWMLAFHPTAPIVAIRRKDGLLALIDLRNGEERRALDFSLGEQVTCAAFSPDGLTCAVGGTNKQFVVFDVDV